MSQLLKYTGGLITKSAVATEDRIVPGYYTSATVDLHGHIMDKNAMLAALEDYRQWNTIREMHEHAIGTAKQIGTPEWNYLEAQIAKSNRGDEVLRLVNEGVYKAFSVGILVTNGEFVPFSQIKAEELEGLPLSMLELYRRIGDVFRITGMTLVEVSVVDRPANPMARVRSIQNELGAQIDGILPDISQPKAMDTIKSVIRSSGIYVPVTAAMSDAVHADSTAVSKEIENSVPEVQVNETVEKELEGDVETSEDADATTNDEVVVVESDAPAAEVVTQEDKVEKDAGDAVADAFLAATTEMTKAVESLRDAVASMAIDKDAFASAVAAAVVEAMSKVAPVEDAAPEGVVEIEDAASESTLTVETKTVEFPDDVITKIADMVTQAVVDKMANERQTRKSAVHQSDNTAEKESQPEKEDLSRLSTKDIAALIAQRAARRI